MSVSSQSFDTSAAHCEQRLEDQSRMELCIIYIRAVGYIMTLHIITKILDKG